MLKAYSIYDAKVGYCQSLNFVTGFILLISGGNQREAFWFLSSLNKNNKINTHLPQIDGVRGLFKKDFPLLLQYLYQFDFVFQQELPELYQHFKEN